MTRKDDKGQFSKPLGRSEENGLVVTWDTEFLHKEGLLISSFGDKNVATSNWLMSVWESQTVSVQEVLNKILFFTDIIAGPAEFMDPETKEQAHGVRTLMLTDTTMPIAFSDDTVARFLQARQAANFSLPPFCPGLPIKITRRKGKRVRGYQIQVVDEGA